MIKLLVVEDHPMVREGLRSVLGKVSDIKIVGEASNVEEAREKMSVTAPDILLVDISLPGKNGITLARELKGKPGAPKVVFLSMYSEKEFVVQAFNAGASGYVVKSAQTDEVVLAIREVSQGNRYISPQLSFGLLGDELGISGKLDKGDHGLSEREKEIVRSVAKGLSAKETARQLQISHRTVETHRTNAMRKLGAKNTADLIRIASEAGLLF